MKIINVAKDFLDLTSVSEKVIMSQNIEIKKLSLPFVSALFEEIAKTPIGFGDKTNTYRIAFSGSLVFWGKSSQEVQDKAEEFQIQLTPSSGVVKNLQRSGDVYINVTDQGEVKVDNEMQKIGIRYSIGVYIDGFYITDNN